jgi:hypothetical protein
MQPQPAPPPPQPPSPQPQAPHPPYAGYPPPPSPYAPGPGASYPAYPQAPYGQPPYPQAPYGQPPYPQATYPQPPAYQPPYGPEYPYPQVPYPPAPPRQGSGKTVGIIIAVIAGVLILTCVAVSILLVSVFRQVGNFVAPYTVANEFCIDEEQQNYLSAYQLLSSGVQQRYSQQEFLTFSENRDNNTGKVVNCTIESTGQQITATTATLSVSVQVGDSTNTGSITLVKEGNDWLVDSADPSLQLF